MQNAEYCLCLNVTLGMTQDELDRCAEESTVQYQQWLRRPSSSAGGESSVSPTSLGRLMNEYTRVESCDEWRCEKCKHLGGNLARFVARRPNILVVYIDRHMDCNPFGKINRRVSFPSRLSLDEWIAKEDANGEPAEGSGGEAYSLFAMCVHQDLRGNTAAGHYVAYVKDRTNSWHLLDDERVQPVNWSSVQDEHPYLLFYATSAPPILPPGAAQPEQKPKPTPAAEAPASQDQAAAKADSRQEDAASEGGNKDTGGRAVGLRDAEGDIESHLAGAATPSRNSTVVADTNGSKAAIAAAAETQRPVEDTCSHAASLVAAAAMAAEADAVAEREPRPKESSIDCDFEGVD